MFYDKHDTRKSYDVTGYYTAKIDKVSVGIYLDSKGYVITVVGIEEEFDKSEKCYRRRYWLLAGWESLEIISLTSIYSELVKIYQTYGIDCINTNFLQLVSILKGLKEPQIIEILPENVITLIKSLLYDRKLEIAEDIKEKVNPVLENYDSSGQNHLANSLYLALNFELDSVIQSWDFPPLPTFRKDLNFEEIPLQELLDYVRENKGDTCASAIYHRRWWEKHNLELEESKRLQQMRTNQNGL